MLDQLKFVQRALARRDIIPTLTHFRIEDGRVSAFDGNLSLSAPVDIGFNAAPAGSLFLQALNACDDTVSLSLVDKKIHVRSGSFRTVVPCVDLADVPTSLPCGSVISTPTSLLTALQTLEPFIGTDASRPWACGIWLHGQSAFATNNVIVVEYWLGVDLPDSNIPASAVRELLAVKKELVSLQVSDESITFHYEDGRWIKTNLYSTQWPNIWQVLDPACDGATFSEVPAGLKEACEKLVRFNDKHDVRCYLRGQDVSTTQRGLEEGGALVELAGLPHKGCYNTAHLAKVLTVAKGVDWERHKRLPFIGDRLRGVMVGLHYNEG